MGPRDYQQAAIDAAFPHDGFGLFMEQRSGKTLTSLWLAQKWGCQKNLIICPKKALPVWEGEIVKAGSNPAHFTLVNFESFLRHKTQYMRSWDLVIIDESHRIKARGSKQTRACWTLGKRAKKRLILTGGPQGNGMEDYYAQLKFIRPDLFTTWEKFSEKYLIIENQWLAGREDPFPKIVGYKNQEEFQRALVSISFRVKRDDVAKIKTLVRNRVYKIKPGEALSRAYSELENQLYMELSGSLVTAPQILTKAMKLHQLCGGFVKDDLGETHQVHSDKLDFLWGLMDTELKGKSLVIVANFKAEMDAISRGLAERGITHVQIRGGVQYDPKDRSQVTILNPAAGEAINLSHHTEMVIYSMNYSFLKWNQFKDRIVLVDTPEVKYHYLMMEGKMDETVYSAVIEKKKLADKIMSIYKNWNLT